MLLFTVVPASESAEMLLFTVFAASASAELLLYTVSSASLETQRCCYFELASGQKFCISERLQPTLRLQQAFEAFSKLLLFLIPNKDFLIRL